MILEHLITAYLDGELTLEQDQELRRSISADPSAREAFNAAVLLHIAMRCEDNTVPPSDLRTSVFAAVEAIAATENRIAGTTGVSQRPIRFGNFRASLVAALLMLVCFPIADQLHHRVANKTIVSNISAIPTNVVAEQHRIVCALPPNKRSVEQQNIQVSEPHQRDVIAETIFRGDTAGTRDGETTQLPTLSVLMGGGVGHNEPSQPQSSAADVPKDLPVYVSTTYATGVGTTFDDASNIRQISASVAYGISDATVGLEFGATMYTISRDVTLLSAIGGGGSGGGGSGGGGYASVNRSAGLSSDPGKLASPDPVEGGYTSSTMKVASEQQQMWGLAFYERKVISISDITLQARLGGGVSEDGVLGTARLVGRVELAGGFSIIAGTEVRTMPFRNGTQTNYGSILTALAGMNLRF